MKGGMKKSTMKKRGGMSCKKGGMSCKKGGKSCKKGGMKKRGGMSCKKGGKKRTAKKGGNSFLERLGIKL
jgi:hypothetical protein